MRKKTEVKMELSDIDQFQFIKKRIRGVFHIFVKDMQKLTTST